MASEQRLEGLSFQTETNGMTTLNVRFHSDTLQGTVDACPTEFEGLPLVSRQGENSFQNEEAGFSVNATYRGRLDGENLDSKSWRLNNSFRNNPIENHPQLARMIEEWGGYEDEDGRIRWPRDIPEGVTGLRASLGTRKVDKNKLQENPLFGVEHYMVFGSIVEVSTVEEELDEQYLARVGTVVDEVPGLEDVIPTPEGRNWMVMAPSGGGTTNSSGVGTVELSHSYMLSPPGGWGLVYTLITI